MKRILSLLAAILMLLAVGCAGKTAPEATEKTATATEATEQPVAEKATVEASETWENYSAENPCVITMAIESYDDYAAELTGIEKEMAKEGKYVKFEVVPMQEGSYADSLSLLLQSGEIPDLIYFQGGDYQFAITQQILTDLRPYIENSEYVKGALEEHSIQRIENYPYLLWISSPRSQVPVVRTDFINQMETGAALLANPTVDNYYAFFTELRQKFTSNSAITVKGASDGLAELDMMFGQAFGATQTWVKNGDGTYSYTKITASELAKLEFYAKLFANGLLDNEYLSKKYSDKEQALYTNETGVILATQNTVVSKYQNKCVAANGESATLTVLPPAVGSDGSSYFTPIAVDKETRGWAISAYSDHKQIVFDVLDWLAGPAGSMLDKLGIEGEQYEITSDNKIRILDNTWWARFHDSVATFDPGMEYESDKPLFAYDVMDDAYEMVKAHSCYDNSFVIPEDLVTDWDAATVVYKEFSADFVSGKKTAADWDDFVQEWLSMGGQAVTDYANSILN
ncbi:MAG: extracellular solute-binding protein [Clostridiaceae bacterium]